MNSCQATWEDTENNRQVDLVVSYQVDSTRVEISNVTPTRVNFLCPTTGKVTRSIGVWTNGGRRVLGRQLKAAGRLNSLKQEIAEGRVVEIKHAIPKAIGRETPVLTA